jgi:hypothetical protein
MIGVIANPEDHAVAQEFFELFKTPWEFYRGDGQYEVLLCSGNHTFQANGAKLVLIYSGQKAQLEGSTTQAEGPGNIFLYKGIRLAIYAESATAGRGNDILKVEESQKTAGHAEQPGSTVHVRVGYDLFPEIRTLLTKGQPAANASLPTLDLHIAILRDLIVTNGVPLVEVPPVPEGHKFIACLTHDVDHPTIRPHKFDHTMFGFLYRAVFGSLMDVMRGRMGLRNLLTNWAAALKLPLVHLGLARDSWYEFDRYLQLEKGFQSSFFVIPFKGRPGQTERCPAPKMRASSYTVSDIVAPLEKLRSAGCEIGLHGIDAWRDRAKGVEELAEIRRFTGEQEIGVRMHWLYFNEQSPAILEEAGAAYDSTVGYNQTIGYRAGTAQAYKPLSVNRLMELPMHVMDTALFYPSHLNLPPSEAGRRVDAVIDNTVRLGGTVTVNWHDRSIAPERLWGGFYAGLVNTLQEKGAWFSTASQAVSWFRKRRSVVFDTVSWESGKLRAKVQVGIKDDLPELRLRIHKARKPASSSIVDDYCDIVLKDSIDATIAL